MGQEEIRLNLGAGETSMQGWTPIDRQLGTEVYPLPYEDGGVTELRASHILEHFSEEDARLVLTEWLRVLAPGCALKVAVPDLDSIAEAERQGDPLWKAYRDGGHVDDNDIHYSTWTVATLKATMEKAGFVECVEWEDAMPIDTAGHKVSARIMGYKPGAPAVKPEEPVPSHFHLDPTIMHCVASMPRLGFTENMACVTRAVQLMRLPFRTHTGAYWEQCLERCIDSVRADFPKTEYILTMDYDTVFTPETICQLFLLMFRHPEADAIAPLQMKREGGNPMVMRFTKEDEVGEAKPIEFDPEDFQADLTQIRNAHFGLTLIRVSALDKLKRPYFMSLPNPEGKWEDGRCDADIYFWENFYHSGCKLFSANRVCIGHMEQLITWPDEDFNIIHQTTDDWKEYSIPKEARQYGE
ncbi:MAG: hypothetical protein GY832_21975 [Chloroflexi bacterium]|nr:hypothetical protein [Chloroflexota bacterium]